MKLKKLSALALSVALLAGCSNGGNEETQSEMLTEITAPVEITFWHAMNGDLEASLQSLTDEFMAANENITVTLQNQSSYNDLQQKITATTASPDDLPTLTQAYPDWMTNLISGELVVDLTPYVQHETIGVENYEDILPGFTEVTTIDGKIYGMPFNKSTEVLWYNKDLFEELNLEVPTTYEEFAEVAKTITEEKGIVGGGFDSLSNYYTTYLKTEGVVFDSNTDVTGEESVAAMNYYLDGVKEGYFRMAGTDMFLSGPFANETLGMYVGSNAGESFVVQGVDGKFEIGVAAYPSSDVMQQGTDAYVLASATPEQELAAYEYLKFITSTESQATWGAETGYIPARQSAIDSDVYQNSGSLVTSILTDATQGLYTNPISVGSDSAYREAATVLEGILADTDSNVEEKLEEYKNTLLGIWE